MQCPTCGAGFAEGDEVCKGCGARLVLVCAHCGACNAITYSRCERCGEALPPVDTLRREECDFEERLAKLQRFLPTGIPRALLFGSPLSRTYLRQATVLLAGISMNRPGEQHSPPGPSPSVSSRSLSSRIFDALAFKIIDYRGTSIEMDGGEILALFGMPIPLEGAPQVAVRCALDMQRKMGAIAREMADDGLEPDLSLSIGLNTGPVLVASQDAVVEGGAQSVENTMRIVLELRDLAGPGEILVAERTFRLTAGFFRFQPLGARRIHGTDDQVAFYKLLGPSERRTRFDLSAERGLTELVGRESELDILLAGFRTVLDGWGRAFSIRGEAGVGKSRLIHEIKKALANEEVTVIEGHCFSHGKDAAYHPIINMLRGILDLEEDSEEELIRERVRKSIVQLGEDLQWAVPCILELLSVRDSGMDMIFMTPEARRKKIMEAVKTVILQMSLIRPVLLVLEDLHWCDKSSLDVIGAILESLPQSRILLLLTSRPSFSHDWSAGENIEEIRLQPLSESEAPVMISYVLGGGAVGSDVNRFIRSKTEGIPFFIEELARSLKELDLFQETEHGLRLSVRAKEVPVPGTIQDIILSRVDALPDNARKVLQTAAVIDREFSHRLIMEATGLHDPELKECLALLKRSGLITERGSFRDSLYKLRHSLTRQVVYESIPPQSRGRLHRAVGLAIEKVFGKALGEHVGKLTDHYIKSGDYAKASVFSGLAAGRARRKAALEDAVRFAYTRVHCLERVPPGEDRDRNLLEARMLLGMGLMELNRMDEARDAVEPILDSVLRGKDKKLQSHVLSILGTCSSWLEEDLSASFTHLETAFAFSEETKDPACALNAAHWLGIGYSLNCDFDLSEEYHEKALALAKTAKNKVRVATIMSSLAGWTRFFRGRMDQAYETSIQAMDIAQESDDIIALAWAQLSRGMCCLGKGMIEDAVTHLSEGLHLSRRASLLVCGTVAQNVLGEIEFSRGAWEVARNLFSLAARMTSMANCFPSWGRLNNVAVMMTDVTLGNRFPDHVFFHQCADSNNIPLYEGWLARYVATAFVEAGGGYLDAAEAWLDRAITADRKNGMMFFLAMDHMLGSRLAKARGQVLERERFLKQAKELFTECGAYGAFEAAMETPVD